MTSFARKLEPHRGFHSLMRSRPPLPQLSPQSLMLVVDGDAVSEGVRLSQGQSYRARPMAENAATLLFASQVRSQIR